MPEFMALFRLVKGWLMLAVVAGVISGFSNAFLLAMINHSLTLADVTAWRNAGLQFAGLAVLMLSTRLISQMTFMFLGQKVKARLRSDLIQRISRTAWLKLEQTGMAKALSVFSQDQDTLVVFFVSLPMLIINVAMIAGCLVYLGVLSLTLFSMALAVIILGSVGYHLVQGRALGLLQRSRAREDRLVQQFKKLFDGGREYRMNTTRQRQFVDGPLEENIEAVRQQRTRGYILYGLATSWGSVLFFAFIGLVVYGLRGPLGLTNPAMTGYTMIFLYLIVPVDAVLSALPALASARVALQRVQQLQGSLPPELSRQAGSAPPFERLALRDIVYRYHAAEGEEFTLGPLSLDFVRGELVFLVGGNGSGKSTLAHVLTGLYPADSGTIRLNDQTIALADLENYRQCFSIVFSDFFLFDDVVFQNPRTQEEVDNLLRLLRLAHKVSFHDGTFSTTALSQGQRKRLVLLQAWLEQRPFYIFDEWAADQDPEFRQIFYQEILPMLKAEGKTILAITHDDRYFHLADRVIKIEEGRLI